MPVTTLVAAHPIKGTPRVRSVGLSPTSPAPVLLRLVLLIGLLDQFRQLIHLSERNPQAIVLPITVPGAGLASEHMIETRPPLNSRTEFLLHAQTQPAALFDIELPPLKILRRQGCDTQLSKCSTIPRMGMPPFKSYMSKPGPLLKTLN